MESSQRPKKQWDSGGFPLGAAVISLVLHGLLLGWSFPSVLSEAAEVAPSGFLIARLQAPAADTIEEVLPKSQAKSVLRRASESALPDRYVVSPSQPDTAAKTEIPNSMLEASSASGIYRSLRESPEAPNVALVRTSQAGPDAAGLRQYRLALAGEARRFRRYPEAAKRGEIAGSVEVRIAIEAGGIVRRAELSRSSGFDMLDEAALEMLRLAVARTELPGSLRETNFSVLMPVVFEVED